MSSSFEGGKEEEEGGKEEEEEGKEEEEKVEGHGSFEVMI